MINNEAPHPTPLHRWTRDDLITTILILAPMVLALCAGLFLGAAAVNWIVAGF